MSKSKVTAEQIVSSWAKALASPAVTDEVPPGWLTLRQIAAKMGKAESTMGAQIGRAVANGACERREFRIRTGSVVRPVPHYRPLAK